MSEVVIEDDDMELDEALDMLGDDADDWSGEDGDEVYVELDTTSTGQSASATSSAEFDISSLITDIDDNVEYLTWFLYGKNGTGKTTALSTIDGMLVLAFEDGTLSIKDKVKADGTQKIRIDVWDKLESIYWHLKNGRE